MKKENKPFKIYIDTGDNYQKPERKFENDRIEIRLYCDHEGCNKYVKGVEGYNGGFIDEVGNYCDLRNQCFMCEEHGKE